MDSFLPMFFALMASLTLLAALAFLWQSLRAAFGTADSFHLPSAEAESRRILEERKTALLSNLADLEFEHAGDKISDEDYEALDKKLRAEAKRVLRLLDDDVKPYRAKAEKRLKGYLSERGTPYRGQADRPLAEMAETKDTKPTPEPAAAKAAPQKLEDESVEDESVEDESVEDEADNTCAKCGTVNDADAAFCKKCGTPMNDEASDEASDGTADSDDVEEAR